MKHQPRRMHIAGRNDLYTHCGRAAYKVEWVTPLSAEALSYEHPEGGFCKSCVRSNVSLRQNGPATEAATR